MKKVILGRIVALLLFAGNGFSPTASSLTREPVKLEGKWLYNSTTVNGLKVNSAGDPDTDFVQFESDRFAISQNGVEKSGTWWLVDKRLKSMDGNSG